MRSNKKRHFTTKNKYNARKLKLRKNTRIRKTRRRKTSNKKGGGANSKKEININDCKKKIYIKKKKKIAGKMYKEIYK